MSDTNLYPGAGKDSQPEIRAAMERFRSLPARKRAELPALWWLLNDTTQLFKMSKADAQYTDTSSGGLNCHSCDYLYFSIRWQKYICSQIKGYVEPEGTCRLWSSDKHADPYQEK